MADKLHCCWIDCDRAAEWEIRTGDGIDDYTHACGTHVGELAEDGSRLLWIGETAATAAVSDEALAERKPTLQERITGKTVIRFDGPPGPEGPRFIEVERDGKSVNAGEWIQDGDHWLLVLDQ